MSQDARRAPRRSFAPDAAASLRDAQGRRLDYLRLSVTDRCNMRCRYCLPPEGVRLTDRAQLLSWEEMHRLCELFARLGVRKIRLTGGEPLLRKGVTRFLAGLRDLSGSPELLLTTNGQFLAGKLSGLAEAGLRRLNLSIDSLREERYHSITRGAPLGPVLRALDLVTEQGFGLKLNTVVMAGVNDDELRDFVELTRDRDWTVRFIEAMPFDGQGGNPRELLGGERILAEIRRHFDLERTIDEAHAVAEIYRVPGYKGRIGLIRGHTRSFCAACNRLRISAQGQLRTCLYGEPVLDLRGLLRDGADDEQLAARLRAALAGRCADGHAAQAAACDPLRGSMSRIGG